MSWDQWTTTPTPTQAHAFLGVDKSVGHSFRINPDTVQWDYKENIASWDTLGGRVVQLLSVSLNSIMIEGRAGNRGELQRMAKNIKEIMGYHVRTLNPVKLLVPSRNWRFDVYVQAMPQIGWEVASTSYPYMLQLMVDADLSGIKTKEVSVEALQRLASGIGFDDSSLVHGGNIQEFSEIIDVITQPFASAQAPDSDTSGTGDVIKGAGCDEPSNLVKVGAFRLQKPAADALKRAQQQATITLSSGYRSCSDQERVCNDMCGGGCNGCSGSQGTCAPCGQSNHQCGLAIDINQKGSSGAFATALRANGFDYLEGDSCACHWDYAGGC